MFFNQAIANYSQVVTAAGGYSKNIVTDGLMCYLDAGISTSNPGSGTTWYDLTPNAYNFTLVNGAAFGGSGASAYVSFDGTNQYASNDSSVLSQIGGLSGFTYQLFVQPDAASEEDIYATNGIGSEGSFLVMFYQNNFVRNHLWTNGGIGVPDNNTGGGITGNRQGVGGGANWSLTRVYAYRTDPTVSTVYVTPSGTQPTSAYTGNQIGTRERSSGAFFNGKVYNMVVYNRSLSDTEIAQNWTALSF